MSDSNTFSPNLGHLKIQERIVASSKRNRMPHAMLLHGPEGCGKDALAIAIAEFILAGDDRTSRSAERIRNLQHPDVKVVFPIPAKSNIKPDDIQEALSEKAANPYRRILFSGKNIFIGIDTIRQLKEEAKFKPYESTNRVFIIAGADKMRAEAANALLKLLEEPPPHLTLILTTSRLHAMLATIKSRCQLYRARPLGEEEMLRVLSKYGTEPDREKLAVIARLSGSNLKKAFEFLDRDVLQSRDQAVDFLRKVILIHRSQELMQIIEPIAGRKDKNEARILLWMLLMWFQDILHLQNKSVSEDELHNADMVETMQKFISYTPGADVPQLIWHIEEAIRELDDARNFNPLLVLVTLAMKLKPKLRK